MTNTTGPISVDGDITPITKQPIDSIDASLWPDMDIADLHDQRVFLQNRLNIVLSNAAHPDVINQMNRGMQMIDQMIASKHTEDASPHKPSGLF